MQHHNLTRAIFVRYLTYVNNFSLNASDSLMTAHVSWQEVLFFVIRVDVLLFAFIDLHQNLSACRVY